MKQIQLLCIGILILTPLSVLASKRSTLRGLSGITRRTSLTETRPALRRYRTQTAIQSTECSSLNKNYLRSLATETSPVPKTYQSPRSTVFESNRPFKPSFSPNLNVISKHPGTFIGLTSGIGAAASAGYAYNKYKKYTKETDLYDNLQRLSYALGHYNPKNQHNKKYVYQLLNEFIDENIINEKDRSGNTPLMIILKAPYVSDEEKAAMLQLIFDNGANPGEDLQKAVDLALGFDRQEENFETKIKPKLKTFEKLLRFIETPTLQSYNAIAQTRIKNDEKTIKKAQEELIIERERKGWKDYLSRRKTVEENNLENLIEDSASKLDNLLNFKKLLDQEIENRLTSEPHAMQN